MSLDNDHPIVIIGAGPAGLTAAAALVEHGFTPIIFETEAQVGGISKTLVHNENRLDIGGHRFFSKNDKVMTWWLERMALQGAPAADDLALARAVPLSATPDAPDPESEDRVMLSRSRLSRIYFLRSLFDYPISLSGSTLAKLGPVRIARIGASYLRARLLPVRPEASLEDFMVNRFGRELYGLFFRDYTEKLWGVPCTEIEPSWGAQRIKGLSVSTAIRHALRSLFGRDDSVSQAETETSLIGRFLYPKLGPGQLWEAVAEELQTAGADLRLRTEVIGIRFEGEAAAAVVIRHAQTGDTEELACSGVLSTMPLAELVTCVRGREVPAQVAEIARGLPYRDFMTVGLLVSRLTLTNPDASPVLDNWIYIQEPEVRLGRLQIFNNWSPYLVADQSKVWLGLEYFCDEGDEMWETPDADFAAMAARELASIGIIDEADIVDTVVHRVKKAYPAYFGTYARFGEIHEWLDTLPNVVVMGRNGMHRYNNMDHSMLSAWAAVDALLGTGTRAAVWDVNADDTYHESADDRNAPSG